MNNSACIDANLYKKHSAGFSMLFAFTEKLICAGHVGLVRRQVIVAALLPIYSQDCVM